MVTFNSNILETCTEIFIRDAPEQKISALQNMIFGNNYHSELLQTRAN